MINIRRVFISHPFSDDPHINKMLVDKICRDIIKNEKDVLPISPLHTFSFIDKETADIRDNILEVCYNLIDECDEVRLYIYCLSRSRGQALENNYAIEQNKNVKYINADRLLDRLEVD